MKATRVTVSHRLRAALWAKRGKVSNSTSSLERRICIRPRSHKSAATLCRLRRTIRVFCESRPCSACLLLRHSRRPETRADESLPHTPQTPAPAIRCCCARSAALVSALMALEFLNAEQAATVLGVDGLMARRELQNGLLQGKGFKIGKGWACARPLSASCGRATCGMRN